MNGDRGRPGKDIRGEVALSKLLLSDRVAAEKRAREVLAEAAERDRARKAREHAQGLSRNGAIRGWRS
jgi:hypothetical protein